MTEEDDEYFDLPEDPELAFVKLARWHRSEYDRKVSEEFDDGSREQYWSDYINQIVGSADGLGIVQFSKYSAAPNSDNLYEIFSVLTSEVLKFSTAVRVRQSRRQKNYSVPLDDATRAKIKHHLDNLLEVARKLEVSENKREAIIAKIVALSSEIEKARTGLEVLGALMIAAATTLGEASDKLEPMRKLIDSVARLFGKAKEADTDHPALPAPKTPKQIEPPKDHPPFDTPDDSDIPF